MKGLTIDISIIMANVVAFVKILKDTETLFIFATVIITFIIQFIRLIIYLKKLKNERKK